MTEIRVADLRFTSDEAAAFLNQVMGLNLSAGDIAALETRTEGWIAGLQLAALSMQGHHDVGGFIQSFNHSLAAEDWEHAAQLLEQIVEAVALAGQAQTVLG